MKLPACKNKERPTDATHVFDSFVRYRWNHCSLVRLLVERLCGCLTEEKLMIRMKSNVFDLMKTTVPSRKKGRVAFRQDLADVMKKVLPDQVDENLAA